MKNNWQIKEVKKCLNNIPKLGSILRSEYLTKGEFPVIDQGQNYIAGYTNNKSLVFSDCLPVIIFGDHTRALKFIDFPFAVGADGTQILKPNSDFDSKFFYYMLMSLDLSSRGYARHFKILKDSEIPIPSIEIQKKVVKILDKKFEKLNRAKKIREESILETQKILLQTLNEIFENGKKNGWKEKKIGDIFILNYGKGISRLERSKNGKYSVYGANGELGKTDKFLIDGDSIIIGRKGSAGEITRVFGKFWPTDVTYFVIEDKNYDIDFAFYLFKYLDFTQYAKGVKPGINRNEIYSLKFYFPPVLEQKKIISKLDILSEKLKTLSELQKSQLEDFKQLEKAYLREAFNGDLM